MLESGPHEHSTDIVGEPCTYDHKAMCAINTYFSSYIMRDYDTCEQRRNDICRYGNS